MVKFSIRKMQDEATRKNMSSGWSMNGSVSAELSTGRLVVRAFGPSRTFFYTLNGADISYREACAAIRAHNAAPVVVETPANAAPIFERTNGQEIALGTYKGGRRAVKVFEDGQDYRIECTETGPDNIAQTRVVYCVTGIDAAHAYANDWVIGCTASERAATIESIRERSDSCTAHATHMRDTVRMAIDESASEFIEQCNAFAACVSSADKRAAMIQANRERAAMLRAKPLSVRGRAALVSMMRANMRGYGSVSRIDSMSRINAALATFRDHMEHNAQCVASAPDVYSLPDTRDVWKYAYMCARMCGQ